MGDALEGMGDLERAAAELDIPLEILEKKAKDFGLENGGELT